MELKKYLYTERIVPEIDKIKTMNEMGAKGWRVHSTEQWPDGVHILFESEGVRDL